LTDLGERWQIEFDSLIQGGSASVVIRCRTANDRSAVMVCLDRRRVSDEAAELRSWRTVHGLYERGRESALRLAAEPSARVLLHGDLTPVNILDGGVARGLVAIDPAPCRLQGWCAAFAGMVALEIAERSSDAQPHLAPLVEFAYRV
jgi:streptomycin 6-kinase